MMGVAVFLGAALALSLLVPALLDGGKPRHPLERQRLRKRPTLADKLKAKGSLK